MVQRPDDFAFRYSWREGSVPPPYHYEYEIAVSAAGDGTIVFWPDYPEHGVEPWAERFAVPAERLDELHAAMVACGVLERHWEEMADPPVGGKLEWMEATAEGQRHVVPSTLEHPEAIEPVYERIRALVPEATWAELMARYEARRDAPEAG